MRRRFTGKQDNRRRFLPRVGLSSIVLIEVLQIAIPFGWLGLIGGISFLEAPLKFRAPNITLALGLGIGKLVFFWLNKVEIALAAVLLVLFFIVKPDQNLVFVLFGVIMLLLTLQTVWLLPLLNARSVAVISESFAASSKAHFIFIAFEVIKFISLFALGTAIANNHLKHG